MISFNNLKLNAFIVNLQRLNERPGFAGPPVKNLWGNVDSETPAIDRQSLLIEFILGFTWICVGAKAVGPEALPAPLTGLWEHIDMNSAMWGCTSVRPALDAGRRKGAVIVKKARQLARRYQKGAALVHLWYRRPDLLRDILAIEGLPSKRQHFSRWFDLASRALRPICCISWDADEKIARIMEHYRVATELGGIMAPDWGETRLLSSLPALGPQYSLKIDEAEWMTVDGLTTMSLWYGIDRMFTISFMLGKDGPRTCAYVGGLQGRGEASIREIYREMTKEAKGVRPRDLTIELFRMLCRAMGVSHIYAVSEDARGWNDRFSDEEKAVASLNYDEAWEERGGQRLNADWFSLPVEPQRRDVQDIPARKRALYRQRYAFLDATERDVTEAVARLVPGRARMEVTSIRPAANAQRSAEPVLA